MTPNANEYATKLLNELKELDRSAQTSYYYMGRLLDALDDLCDTLGYDSLNALVDRELLISTGQAHKYRRTYRHLKRLHYSEKQALEMIAELSFSRVAEQVPHMKTKIGTPVIKQKIEAEGNRTMSFALTPAEYAEAKRIFDGFAGYTKKQYLVNYRSELFMELLRSVDQQKGFLGALDLYRAIK